MRFSLIIVVLMASSVCLGQQASVASPDQIRSSPAYAEILLRKTELQADFESVVADYTEAHPKIVDLRSEIASLERSSEKVLAVKLTDAAKLTLALGKLIVKKAVLDMELNRLTRGFNKDHPDVKRAKRRVEIFESAIGEILK